MTPRPTQRSYASDHAATGYTARNVAQSTADAGVRIAELAASIIEKASELDEDTKPIIRAASELSKLGVEISDVQWNVADGNYADAKRAATKLKKGRK